MRLLFVLLMFLVSSWGRNSEVPSEDPLHSGEFGRYFVRGMAGGPGPWDPSKGKYLKVSAALKHLTAYSREQGRMSDNYNVSSFDLSDTYLAAFANAISHNPGSGYMCSCKSSIAGALLPAFG